MRKIILLFLFPVICFGAVEPDLRKGVDFTRTNISTQVLLNQLVDNATIVNTGSHTNGKGIIMRSTVRPDVTSNPRMTNWLWLDLKLATNGVGTLRQYVCCGDTDDNWVQATLGVRVVQTFNIADYSITAQKMATNSVANYALQAFSVGGNIIQDQGISIGKLAPASITNGNFIARSITSADIALNSITNGLLADNTINSNKISLPGIIGANIVNNSLAGSNKIAFGSIQRTNLANSIITTDEIVAGTITSNNIAQASISKSNLETNINAGLTRAWMKLLEGGTVLKAYNMTGSGLGAGLYTNFFNGNFTPSSSNYIVIATPLNPSASFVRVLRQTITGFSLQFNEFSGASASTSYSVVVIDF